jgi:hypothetical protein
MGINMWNETLLEGLCYCDKISSDILAYLLKYQHVCLSEENAHDARINFEDLLNEETFLAYFPHS